MKSRPFVAAVLALLCACSATDTTDAGVKLVSGNYQLSTVNGQPLPFTESSTTPVTKLTGSKLVVRIDGTFTETSTRSMTTPTGTTTTSDVSTGTFSVGGQVVSFISSGTFNGLGSYNITLSIPVNSEQRLYVRE